jgi:hypothetical protein
VIYIVVDPNAKHPVQAAYQIPEGMSYEVAEAKIKAAHQFAGQDPDNNPPSETLEDQGFESVPWLAMTI